MKENRMLREQNQKKKEIEEKSEKRFISDIFISLLKLQHLFLFFQQVPTVFTINNFCKIIILTRNFFPLSVRYNDWLEQKRKTAALAMALEKEQQKLKELELKEKKEKSDEAFQAWLKKVGPRMKTVPHSYAKCDGAVTGSCV